MCCSILSNDMTTELKLLCSYDTFDYTPEMIRESREKNSGKVILKGILQKADTLNQNQRIYPRHILGREIRNYQKFILENRSLGELDHPDDSVVNLKNVSHIVRAAEMKDDGVVYGSIELLNTPSGMILQSLVESGVKLGISSRGVGSTTKEGDNQVVGDDYLLICFDMVSEPSTASAFMLPEGRKITSEQLREVFSRSDRIDRVLNDIIAFKR
jgi:hypothetical protein